MVRIINSQPLLVIQFAHPTSELFDWKWNCLKCRLTETCWQSGNSKFPIFLASPISAVVEMLQLILGGIIIGFIERRHRKLYTFVHKRWPTCVNLLLTHSAPIYVDSQLVSSAPQKPQPAHKLSAIILCLPVNSDTIATSCSSTTTNRSILTPWLYDIVQNPICTRQSDKRWQ